ncbi:cation:proton antiporter [Synechococcus sp. CCY 9618]|uniref:cation:proton antiporter domain-containing protein n=1 Tax=Synechococcus sp. CCY 9618 TaxID=2815602 RepID=UPI001C243C7C|nr:cation:proton antiporter [Synechococcus sp. CCY 9618]
MHWLGLAELLLLALVADGLFRRLGVPGLIGMLLVGVGLGASGLDALDPKLLAMSGDLRQMALIVILLRVGFGLNLQTLRSVGRRVLLLAWIPASCEGLTITIVAQPLLGLSPLEAGLLGSVIAAVSPAVVVPLMLRLIEEQRGTRKAIPQMVMAAASLDDIAVIVVNGILLGLLVERSSAVTGHVLGLPVGLALGAIVGALLGWMVLKAFQRFQPNPNRQVLFILALALLLLRLQDQINGLVPFTGLVAAIAIGVTILELSEETAHVMARKLASIWVFAELLLFVLVGAQLNLDVALESGLAGFGVLGIGLAARSAATWACLGGSQLTAGEKLFVTAAYIPKATVQAAIGAVPLMTLQAAGMSTRPGDVILAVAVLSILITAPLGAWLSGWLAARVLTPELAELAPQDAGG